ncbi:MAG: LysR substrate-binding domain-containing protein [Burkholderiaceae bacterium]
MSTLPDRIPALGALRAFEAVARLGSVSLAALELNVTKSAVSHQLRALETELGCTLLNRGGALRQAEVTEPGERLLEGVTQALAVLQATCREVRQVAAPARQRVIRISANPSLASLWLAARIGEFGRLHPNIHIQVQLHAHRAPAWTAKGPDIVLIHMQAGGPHAAAAGDIALLSETVVPICSPALIAPDQRSNPDILRRHRLIQEQHIDSPETDWSTWGPHLGAGALPTEQVLLLAGLTTVVGAVAAGVGIALGRAPLIDDELSSGRLVELFPGKRMRGSWGYVMRLRPDSLPDEALETLVDFLVQQGRC